MPITVDEKFESRQVTMGSSPNAELRYTVRGTTDDVAARVVIISFDARCLGHARRRYAAPIGWVLRARDARTWARAREMAPQYLFLDRELAPAQAADLWPGPWQWGVYVINDLSQALAFAGSGFHCIETDAIGDLLDQYRAGPPAD